MSDLQPNPQSEFPRAVQCLSDGSGVEDNSERFDLFGRQVKVVSDATRASWSRQLQKVAVFESFVSLSAEKCISAEAFNLLVRNLNDGNPSREGLDARIGVKDIEFVTKVVLELKGHRTAEEISSQIDRALFLGGLAKLRSLHETNKLNRGLVPVNSSAKRIKTVLAAFAGVRDAMMLLQVPAVSSVRESGTGDASDTTELPARAEPDLPEPSALPAPEARQAFRSPSFGEKNASVTPLKVARPTIFLAKTGQTNSGGDSIYTLQFFQEGRLVGQFRLVSGNASAHSSTGLSSDASLPSSGAEKAGSAESGNPAPGGVAEGTRWFIEAHSSNQGCCASPDSELDSSSPKKGSQGGVGGCIEKIKQEGGEVILGLMGKQAGKNHDTNVDVS